MGAKDRDIPKCGRRKVPDFCNYRAVPPIIQLANIYIAPPSTLYIWVAQIEEYIYVIEIDILAIPESCMGVPLYKGNYFVRPGPSTRDMGGCLLCFLMRL